MHVIQYSTRIYFSLFLFLCAAVLSAPTVNASIYTWDDALSDFDRLKRDVDQSYRELKRPVNSTLTPSSSAPTVSKNAAGGLSVSTNQILKEMGRSTEFAATSNYSAASAKNALKSCVRSPACATKALGTVGVIYEGIQGWIAVHDFFFDDETGTIVRNQDIGKVVDSIDDLPPGYEYIYGNLCNKTTPTCDYINYYHPTYKRYYGCNNQPNHTFVAGTINPPGYVPVTCVYISEEIDNIKVPVLQSEVDLAIDNSYVPESSDFPVLVSDSPTPIILREPESRTLSTPAPIELPATTTTTTDSQGNTTTSITNSVINYNIVNNNSSSPSIDKSVTETTTTYDDNANIMSTSTSTTTDKGVQVDAPISTSGGSGDIELPPFCSYASIVCDWIGWTKEPLNEEEPDLSLLISDFEPDEDGFDPGIGSGSCPAPMMLNLGIISKTVEVKYDPFCSFLEMIKPFVLAAAYLFAAYLYVGVLRRG